MKRHLLIVEPDPAVRAFLSQAARRASRVDAVAEFHEARGRVMGARFEVVATNVRLEAFNGLHLPYLLAGAGRGTRVLAYGEAADMALVPDVREAGAFWALRETVALVLPRFVRARRPPCDRRRPQPRGRRWAFRGGRRASDLSELSSCA